jgi:WhiB family transcriptional regulator, redox-sensing transcriptional regulator
VPGTQGITSKTAQRAQWLDAGACRSEDPELFFPITASGPSARQIAAAKEVCHRCGVQNECLHYALESHQSYGVWGGTSEEERVRMAEPHRNAPSRAESRTACTPSAGARRPSRRIKSEREGRNAGHRA